MAHTTKDPSGAKTTDKGGGGRLFYLLGALIIVAGVAWLLTADRGGTSASLPTPAEFEAVAAEVEADPATGIPVGSESAPVEIVEFADYSCPHCASFAGFAGRLLRQNYVETGTGDGPVRWILYDYVLGMFPNSVPAHMAARCAGEQGRYWPMHDQLFARQTRWAQAADPGGPIAEIAEAVGLDMGAYRECMAEARYLPEIAASRKYGESLGVNSTPTIFLDGQRIDLQGREPYGYLEGLIRAKLEAAAGGEDVGAAEETGSGGS